ncbi:MAG: hypothetical protein ACUVSW_12520 [Roseiflexus sp.]
MVLTDPPAYDPDLFVNREHEIRVVTDALQGIARGDPEQVRTIMFRGERGLGKSWLAIHLHRFILKEEAPRILPGYRVMSLLFYLTSPPSTRADFEGEWRIESDDEQAIAGGDETRYEPVLQNLLAWVAKQLDVIRAPYAPLRDMAAWLAQDVKQLLDGKQNLLICLLFDSVFETNWHFLDYLERYLLATFAALPRVLIVMTGRGRPYLWKSPYLRTECEEQSLTPFSGEQVAEQIRRSLTRSSDFSAMVTRLSDSAIERLAQQVIDLGGGYPLTNDLLAGALVRQALNRLPDDRRTSVEHLTEALHREEIDADVLQEVALRLLDVVPQERRDRLRKAFDALCVLKEGFRENEMPYLLAALQNTQPEGEQYTIAAMRALRDQLLETNLVRWQDKRYVLDEAVRAVLEQYLKLRRPDDWRRLHECAAHLYTEWAQKYQSSRDHYEQRAVYHRSVLEEDAAHTAYLRSQKEVV